MFYKFLPEIFIFYPNKRKKVGAETFKVTFTNENKLTLFLISGGSLFLNYLHALNLLCT